VSPFSSPRRPVVALPGGPLAEAGGKMDPLHSGGAHQAEGEARDAVVWHGGLAVGKSCHGALGGSFIGLGVRLGEVQCPESNPISNLSFNQISN
jgi:hypothetical protein